MKRALAILRVLGLVFTLMGIIAAVAVRRAEARLVEELRGFGEQVASIGAFSPHSAPRRLVVNGLELGVFTVGTQLDVKLALDRFQGLCRSAGQVDLPARVRQKLEAESPGALSDAGVIRRDSESDGFVACLDVGSNSNGEGLLGRLVEFGRTQNLRSLGQLRYAIARRHDRQTTLVILWTNGNTQLNGLFPRTGDAPGHDLDGIARPEGSARLLSATELGMPYGLAVYGVLARREADVRAAYCARLAEQGWRVEARPKGILAARKGTRLLLVRVNERAPGKVLVSLADLG